METLSFSLSANLTPTVKNAIASMDYSLATAPSEKVVPLSYFWTQYWRNDCDPRVDGYFGLDTPWLMLAIMTSYVLTVKWLGPKLMERRPAFVLRTPMLVYNVLMVVVNSYFLVEALICLQRGTVLLDFKFPPRDDRSPFTLRVIHSAYLYYLTKYVDLMDTVFFVLRKKYSQISTLHLYHHTSVPILGWLALKIGPTTPPLLLFASINSLIHVIMYSYYALAALGPEIQKYLWWKKYLTQLQLIQFIILGFYGLLMFKFQTGYQPVFFYMGFIQPPIFFWMFYDFYRQSYLRRKAERSAKAGARLTADMQTDERKRL